MYPIKCSNKTNRDYERQALSAEKWKLEIKKSNTTLSPDQHDLLAELCTIRHKIHSIPTWRFFREESDDMVYLTEILDQGSFFYDIFPKIDAEIFKEIEESVNSYWSHYLWGLPDDEDEEMSDDEKNMKIIEFKEKINNDILSFLSQVDVKYGTQYSPRPKGLI